MLDTEKLKAWMKEHGYTREMLAAEIGAQKRSLDNYFTANQFPVWAEKHILRIMQTPPTLRFTDAEFDRLERARAAAGYTDRAKFYLDAVNIHAAQILAEEASKITHLPDRLDRVADDETPYTIKTPAKGDKSKPA